MYNFYFAFYFRLYYLASLIYSFFCSYEGSSQRKKILYLENFPIENAGYQYRANKWAELLRKEGYQVDIWTLFEDKREFEKQINQKPFSSFLTRALKIRFKQVLASRQYETVIVRRELLWFNDYGDLFMDKLLLKLHPNAILDFDDDIAAAKCQPKKIKNWFARFLGENGNKFNDSLRLYKKFIVASAYLREKVLKENLTLDSNSICIIPTCVDYDRYTQKKYPQNLEKLTLGWIGGNHNYPQLDMIIPILNEVAQNYDFKLLVIGGDKYERDLDFQFEFFPWSLDKEVELLCQIDIGLMPLIRDEEARGKGGFKLIQYMGLGIPAFASGITINNEIISEGQDGFLLNSLAEWNLAFVRLFEGSIDVSEFGNNARKKIIQNYTFTSNLVKYKLFLSQCVV